MLTSANRIIEAPKKSIINATYRSPFGKIKPFKTTLKDILSKNALYLIKQYCISFDIINCCSHADSSYFIRLCPMRLSKAAKSV